MIHSPIQLDHISYILPHKVCFENFTANIRYGDRIAIIGRNGAGKSSILNILLNKLPCDGRVMLPKDAVLGYVPQIIEDKALSGAERFQNALTEALSLSPNCLLLDEPSNHLDQRHRKNLMRMLNAYSGTLIVVSHDTELLRTCINTLWHIDNAKINVFTGYYDDYIREKQQQRFAIEQKLSRLDREKKGMHLALMKEQNRAAKSKAKGEKSIKQRKWPTIVSDAKALSAQETSGKKKAKIAEKKLDLVEKLTELRLPEIILPRFSINASNIRDQNIVCIDDGTIGYVDNAPLLRRIYLSLYAKDRIAIKGDNASGKSTLIKAILNDPSVVKSGNWIVPKHCDIGYLDQHYGTLSSEKTVHKTIEELAPDWSILEIRRHLNDFLFRKNEEVYANISQLSGGEKARLSLAQIAVKTPKLLILDEITNNLDLETKQHVTQVLQAYPAALIVISHEQDFLDAINVAEIFEISENSLVSSKLD